MDKPKLTLREIIFEGIKKFAGEIIGVVLIACFLWFFPSLKSLFTEHTFPEKKESQSDIQRELEAHRKEEERLKEELKRHEEALKKAEDSRQKTEPTSSMQTVKADVRVQEAATQTEQKSGVELLRGVLEKYGPEDFFSASLNPKIFYDDKTKKPYIQVTEKFNQSLFWDEFLPELRNALDVIAVKKSKHFYADDVRKANQTLNKQGYFESQSDFLYPYKFHIDNQLWDKGGYKVIVPDNTASFMLYEMPMAMWLYDNGYSRWSIASVSREDIIRLLTAHNLTPEQQETGIILLQFIQKMCKPFAYLITYLDNDENVISVQVIRKAPGAFTVYRSFNRGVGDYPVLARIMQFAPGYIFYSEAEGRDFEALGTGNLNKKYGTGCTVELDSDELQRLDTMKFEVIFE